MKTTVYKCDACEKTMVLSDGPIDNATHEQLGWRFIRIDFVLAKGMGVSKDGVQVHICSDKCAVEFIEKFLPAFAARRR